MVRIATAQMTMSADSRRNGKAIRALMRAAHEGGARLILFPEAALSGYVKAEIHDWNDVDWKRQREELESVAVLAGELGLWTVVGCNYPLTAPHRPHNSLFIISAEGKLVHRYDKRYCSSIETADWYTPGFAPHVFMVGGMRFGCAICIEVQYPEVFLDYEQRDVDCVLLATYSDEPMFGTIARAHAATNGMWIALSTPAHCSHGLASSVIGPDGEIASECNSQGEPGLAFADLDRDAPAYARALHGMRPWRRTARAGEVYSRRSAGDDPRSVKRVEW